MQREPVQQTLGVVDLHPGQPLAAQEGDARGLVEQLVGTATIHNQPELVGLLGDKEHAQNAGGITSEGHQAD
eukprot:9154922-Pyramimonas_sp.AAC.1